jgi:ferric-dicitrate binding protein FerR (iron transport regulator)
MKRDEQAILDRATRELRADVPDVEEISGSASRSARLLGIEMNRESFDGAIRNCDGAQQLLGAYRTGALPVAKKLLVEAHLHECGVCLRLLNRDRGAATLNWSTPGIATTPRRRSLAWGWALAVSAALLVAGLFVYKAYWEVPPAVRAEVQSVDGSVYLEDGTGDRRLVPGAKLREGEELRTAGDSRSVLRLADGSVVEVNQRTTLGVGARGRDMTVTLNGGALIVQAARRTSGHLYVQTPDCRVAVTGTVFSVDAGIKGSRVAVLQGTVHVTHSGVYATLHPGDQLETSDNLAPEPLENQFAWSPDREKYVGLMAKLANIQHQIAQIPFPQARYSSDLLARMPVNTQLYISIPNLGDFLSQANAIFQDQLSQSLELQQWWTHGHQRDPQALNDLVAKIHDVSQYLGDEVVVVASGDGSSRSVAIVADVEKSGLKDELRQISDTQGGLKVLDPASLAVASGTAATGNGVYALMRDREIVISNSIATLKQLNSQLDVGDSGFATTNFGKQIVAAYGRGAGIILAADLHAMMKNLSKRMSQTPANHDAFEDSGLNGVEYLIAEHRDANGMPANHLNLQFTGTRQRMASWLASPASMGSLNFVSPNAAVALATLTKEPAAIADDLMAMASQARGEPANWSEIDSKLQISVRDDLAANLGGEFLLALDGPVLPTPSWKMVIEVNNSNALENALERMTQAMRSQVAGSHAHPVTIESSVAGSQQYYAIRDVTSGAIVAEYTFANGYMIVAPNRALVMDALQTRASGASLASSTAFRALLPRDENEDYSAVAYQNLSPVLTPLLSRFSGNSADAIRKLAADARPTVICAWGKENRIEAATDSRLFGFDFLTLGAILDSRNKTVSENVKQ